MGKSEQDISAQSPGRGHLLGRRRAEEPDSATEPPGPVFGIPPPDHAVLLQLHTLWISATDETIGGIVKEVREIAESAPDHLAPWVETYVDAMDRLEHWLRDH